MRPGRTSAALQRQDLPDIGAPIEVRRHPGARRMTLRVSRTRRAVIVTLPVSCALDEANTFVNRNIEWVRERLGSVPTYEPFRDGGMLPLRGRMRRIAFCGTETPARGRAVVSESLAGAEPVLAVAGRHEHAARRLADWLSAEARRDLDAAVTIHAGRLGVAAKRIVVRDQSSRWGSCSTTGVLSFSWRLVMAPSHVLDYVAAHEAAHLCEMNHGPRFWALVRQTMPGMDDAKSWLRTWGSELHRYGPPR